MAARRIATMAPPGGSVRQGEDLTNALAGAGPNVGYEAINQSWSGRPENEWMMAFLQPTADESPRWWVTAIEAPGIVSTHRLPCPAGLITGVLAAHRVAGAFFEPKEFEPAPAHPWLHGEKRADNRSVYFIQAETHGLIKIGVGSPTSRLQQIQGMSPVPLRLLGHIDLGGSKLEGRLHRLFADARSHGEWFHPVPDLLAYINVNAVPAARKAMG